jgi:hypothetical protein
MSIQEAEAALFDYEGIVEQGSMLGSAGMIVMDDMSKYLAGGFVFELPTFTVTVPNITPDSATGIGSWTEAMFLAKFRTNSTPEILKTEPGKFNTIMPWSFYGTMKEHDLKSIYAYLKTIKPISNKIEKWPQ